MCSRLIGLVACDLAFPELRSPTHMCVLCSRSPKSIYDVFSNLTVIFTVISDHKRVGLNCKMSGSMSTHASFLSI